MTGPQSLLSTGASLLCPLPACPASGLGKALGCWEDLGWAQEWVGGRMVMGSEVTLD